MVKLLESCRALPASSVVVLPPGIRIVQCAEFQRSSEDLFKVRDGALVVAATAREMAECKRGGLSTRVQGPGVLVGLPGKGEISYCFGTVAQKQGSVIPQQWLVGLLHNTTKLQDGVTGPAAARQYVPETQSCLGVSSGAAQHTPKHRLGATTFIAG
jgi:hypothetical protein